MSWGTELWDQHDVLSLHTQKGIDFLERYGHFIRDRCLIEVEYASKLRQLVKRYQPEKKDEEYQVYSACKTFKSILGGVNDLADQRDVVAENLQSDVVVKINCLVEDIKKEKKKIQQDSAKCMELLNKQVASLDRSRKKYGKAFKEAETASDNFQRAGADPNFSQAKVEKQRLDMVMKYKHCEKSKNDYARQLQKTNEIQSQHYKVAMPNVLRQLQELEEKRIRKIRHFMAHSANVERNTFPVVNQCMDGVINAANEINEKQDTILLIEKYKSDFGHHVDLPFDDLSRGKEPTPITVPGDGKTYVSSSTDDHRTDSTTVKVTTLNGKLKKLVGRFAKFRSDKNNLSSSGDKNDYSELPSDQRGKETLEELDDFPLMCTALYAFEATSEGCISMFDGEQLEIVERDQGDGWTHVRRQYPNTEEGFVPMSYISVHSNRRGKTDDLPLLCTALYAFEDVGESSIPMFEGEQLQIVERDQGNGWTHVKRQRPNGEEGFVPTSYIYIHSSSLAER